MSEELTYQTPATIEKPKKSKKKLLILLVSIVAVLAIVAVLLLSNSGAYEGPMYSSKEEVYSYFDTTPHDTLCYDMSEYADTIAKENKKQISSSNSSELDDYIRQSVALPDKYSSVTEKGNQLLSSFFAENYGISVDAELAELSVHHADLHDMAGGAFAMPSEGTTDGKTIVMDSGNLNGLDECTSEEELRIWEQKFYTTYLHETLHYLGSANDGDSVGWCEFTEGVTQALTMELLAYGGYDADNSTLYVHNTKLAQQLFVADKSIVTFLIEGAGYHSDEAIEEWFDSKSFDGFGDAFQDAVALTGLFSDKKEDQEIAQHLMGEYLKRYDLTETQMVEIADSFIAPISKISK